MKAGVGLRERKKAATRRALSVAALRLAMEHGVSQVTAEAIAEAADVSTRTFHNYFSSKEEAIVAVLGDRAQELIEAFLARPADEPVWDALENVMVGLIDGPGGTDKDLVSQLTFIRDNAPLLARELTVMKATIDGLAQAVAERSGTDTGRDLYPHLQSAAGIICARFAMDAWLADPAAGGLADRTREAFAQMRAGLPPPDRHS